jgi:2'-5' RNA ligase
VWFVGAPVSFAGDPLLAVPAGVEVVATRPADRHVTLVFLGRVPQESALDLWAALPPLTVPEHVGAVAWERFGRNAIALSVADDDDQLRAATDLCLDVAVAQLTDLTRPAGFRPHVTLGRIRKRARPPTPAALRGWPVPADPLHVGPPTLFRSRGRADGDRYEVVARQDG